MTIEFARDNKHYLLEKKCEAETMTSFSYYYEKPKLKRNCFVLSYLSKHFAATQTQFSSFIDDKISSNTFSTLHRNADANFIYQKNESQLFTFIHIYQKSEEISPSITSAQNVLMMSTSPHEKQSFDSEPYDYS